MSSWSGESDDQLSMASSQGFHGDPSSASVSPSQQVPQSACALSKILYSVGINSYEFSETPYLKIIEQPQSHYKFRYRSEMENSHGCLYGKTYENNKTLAKTYPEAELCMYNGKAKIKCELVQVDNAYEHPHKLYVNDKEQIGVEVTVKDNYRVRFQGLCIIHTAQKDIKNWLYRGHVVDELSPEDKNALFKECESMAKLIDLNRLRLKFSAVAFDSDTEICDPVYSDPIQNLKNPKTNKLKICRMSRSASRVTGGDDVFILVEKVVKKNIMIRFFELSEDGDEVWSAKGKFMESDVHHQYAIVFSTPRYRDQNIRSRVKVWLELLRPSDGEKSEPVEFYYTPGPAFMYQSKKRKITEADDNQGISNANSSFDSHHAHFSTIQQVVGPSMIAVKGNIVGLQSYSLITASEKQRNTVSPDDSNHSFSTTAMPQSQSDNYPDNMVSVQSNTIELNDTNQCDISTLLPPSNIAPNNDDLSQFYSFIDEAKISSPAALFPEIQGLLEYMDSENISSDSGRGESSSSMSHKKLTPNETENNDDDQAIIRKMTKQLQSMIKLIRILDATKTETIKKSLEALFELRLSNGDTFLHVILSSKQPFLDYIINQIHDAKMVHLLNLGNAAMQTILHLAVVNDLPDMIPMLLSKGCDPMLEDIEGNNVVHYAVIYESCLDPLLKAIKELNIPHDLDAYNNERQTALHLAARQRDAASARALLAAGASCVSRDAAGRAALHAAARAACASVLAAAAPLVPPKYIDEMDDQGYTVLQILCDQEFKEDFLGVIKILLEKNADPLLKRGGHKTTAWSMAKDKPEIRKLMRKYLAEEPAPDDEDEESEEEFESADEGEFTDEDDELFDTIEALDKVTIKPATETVTK